MRSTLLKLLGTLLCTLAVCAEVLPAADFDLQKMAGKWYLVALATNSEWFVNHRDSMKMSTATLVPTPGNDLDFTYAHLNDDGSCWKTTHLAKKTDLPGRFTFRSHVWNNDNVMTVADVSYDDYAMIQTIKTKDGVTEVLTKLYSRTQDSNVNMQAKFSQFAVENGILPENVAFLPKNGECVES